MSAVAELPATAIPAPVPATGLAGRWQALSRGQRLRFALGAALLAAAAVAAVVFSRQADWKVLYANLPDKDGGTIVAQLATMNVPYKYAEGGAAILVPADRVHDVRLKLASQGLPKSSVAGFELMENNRFGMTQFQERLTFQRGLEGELTRSIQALSSVQSARIHLALPNQNGFFREQQKPSASVLLTLYPGRFLDRAQIAGIVHLVASSVPEMPPSAVSVLDDTGKLLSTPPDGAGTGAGAGGDGQQLQYVQQLEREYTRRILDILEPVVGRNNVKAQVTAEVDFSQSESTSEQHRPNQAADAGAIRSQQTTEVTGAGAAPPAGVPGATTNQPPAQPAAPINGQAVPPAAAGAAAAGAQGTSKRESITNYEVDKTVKVTRAGSGAIKRLSAAVVVNYQMPTAAQAAAAKGESTPQALSAQQIEQMTALVRETIGFNKDRGDSVNLMNTPFLVEAPDTTILPLWKQPEVLEWARSLGWPVGMLVFALVVILGLVRPVLRAGREPVQLLPAAAPGGQLDALIEDTPQRAALPAPGESTAALAIGLTPEQARLEDARRLAKENPTAVANIVKNWVNGEMAA
ncbi:MAG: flagellar basal-body MS-ring/collar protein FliF [Xylophilus ampelinus]